MPLSALLLAAATPTTVAVTFDRTHAHVALAEGPADMATGRAATASDPVRIASVSKLVMTIGLMRLVDQGKLDLDRDVSDYLGWRLRNPAFPDAPITLRLLLSHRSSLTDDAGYVIPLGETLRQRVADPRAWDRQHGPGSDWFHYTNLNFPVAASVMEKVTGERFDRLITRLVLAPLKLDACYNWSVCSPKAIRQAVVLYRATGEAAKDDLHGAPPACPVETAPGMSCDLAAYRPGDNGALFSPQGGLRISMLDLAKVGQLLARKGAPLLSAKAFATMTAPAWRYNGHNGVGESEGTEGLFCAYGLATHTLMGAKGAGLCRDGLFADGRMRIGHSGSAYGLRSGVWVDPATGKGVAWFTTAVPDDAPLGQRSAFTLRAEQAIAKIYP